MSRDSLRARLVAKIAGDLDGAETMNGVPCDVGSFTKPMAAMGRMVVSGSPPRYFHGEPEDQVTRTPTAPTPLLQLLP